MKGFKFFVYYDQCCNFASTQATVVIGCALPKSIHDIF